jgi:hypothetical protein
LWGKTKQSRELAQFVRKNQTEPGTCSICEEKPNKDGTCSLFNEKQNWAGNLLNLRENPTCVGNLLSLWGKPTWERKLARFVRKNQPEVGTCSICEEKTGLSWKNQPEVA